MTSKEHVTDRLLAHAIYVAGLSASLDYEAMIRRIQDEDILGRDLTLRERNMVRAWFDMSPEVSESEQCA